MATRSFCDSAPTRPTALSVEQALPPCHKGCEAHSILIDNGGRSISGHGTSLKRFVLALRLMALDVTIDGQCQCLSRETDPLIHFCPHRNPRRAKARRELGPGCACYCFRSKQRHAAAGRSSPLDDGLTQSRRTI